jgi:hypothetical protein
VESDPRVLGEPSLDLRGAVGRRVVEDHVQLNSRVLLRDVPHESEEVGAGVAVLALVRHMSRVDVERRVELNHALAPVVVSVSDGPPFTKWERNLRSLKSRKPPTLGMNAWA